MSAIISECKKYRYRLERQIADAPGGIYRPLTFIMLNPSTADAETDDRTIGQCIKFARRENATHLVVVNLFAWRDKSPAAMREAGRQGANIIGPHNNWHISKATGDAFMKDMPVIAAWGKQTFISERVKWALEDSLDLYCLGLTKEGHPRHPLYVKGVTPLQRFN